MSSKMEDNTSDFDEIVGSDIKQVQFVMLFDKATPESPSYYEIIRKNILPKDAIYVCTSTWNEQGKQKLMEKWWTARMAHNMDPVRYGDESPVRLAPI